jgi:hypothetical protein
VVSQNVVAFAFHNNRNASQIGISFLNLHEGINCSDLSGRITFQEVLMLIMKCAGVKVHVSSSYLNRNFSEDLILALIVRVMRPLDYISITSYSYIISQSPQNVQSEKMALTTMYSTICEDIKSKEFGNLNNEIL